MNQPAIILVVDDVAANRETLRELLDADKYRVIEAVDGPSALRLAAETPPDLVLLDVMMPGMDGYEVCRRLRADARLAAVPVIMVTALDDQASRLAGIEAGADDFITKPINRVELRARVRTITRLNRYRRLLAAQTELRESERKFLSVFQNAAVGLVIAEAPEFRIVEANRRLCEMLGYTAAELLQLTVRDITHPDEIAQDLQRMAQVNSGQIREYSREKRYRKKDGSCIWAKVFVAPLDPLGASNSRLIGVIEDITARKQAEIDLRESAERYRLLFESNPVPMWLSDPGTLRFLAVNGSAVRHYGYTREEFLAMTIKEIHLPEDIPAFLKILNKGPAETTRSSDSRHRRKDGTIMQVEVISTPLRFDGREARLVLATDVTEKKLLEEKFLHAQRLESIGMLAAGIAHDLNNMLAPILFTTPLLRASLTAPRDLKILDTLEQSAGRGAGLVKQILGFAHCTTGEFRSTQVKHLARDIIGLIEETFPKSIRLQHNIPTDLWAVPGNATQIHQVLLNLCVNARDAMPAGGTLRLTAANRRLNAAEAGTLPGARPGPWLMFEVADTGTGIAPGVLERIWTPFFTTKGIGKGTGLGLSTVRGIVITHQGFIELQTEVGRGSTFRVYLPADEGEAPQPDSAAPSAIPDGHGELILVVDDDKAFREIVTVIVGNRGYRVVSCADGLEALTLFNARPNEFSLVVTDVDMPRLGGVALARAVRQIRADIPVIAMSGFSHDDTDGSDVPEIRKLAHALLNKPCNPGELLGAMHQLLHQLPKPELALPAIRRIEEDDLGRETLANAPAERGNPVTQAATVCKV